MKVSPAFPYLASLISGALCAALSPEWLLLPIFFTLIGSVAVLTVASHQVSTPEYWKDATRVVAAVLMVIVGPGGTQTKAGPMPRLLILAMLSALGFVSVLLAHR